MGKSSAATNHFCLIAPMLFTGVVRPAWVFARFLPAVAVLAARFDRGAGKSLLMAGC